MHTWYIQVNMWQLMGNSRCYWQSSHTEKPNRCFWVEHHFKTCHAISCPCDSFSEYQCNVIQKVRSRAKQGWSKYHVSMSKGSYKMMSCLCSNAECQAKLKPISCIYVIGVVQTYILCQWWVPSAKQGWSVKSFYITGKT